MKNKIFKFLVHCILKLSGWKTCKLASGAVGYERDHPNPRGGTVTLKGDWKFALNFTANEQK